MDFARTLKLLILGIMVIAVTLVLIIQLPKTYIAHLSYQEYKDNVKREQERNRRLIEEMESRPPVEILTQEQIEAMADDPRQRELDDAMARLLEMRRDNAAFVASLQTPTEKSKPSPKKQTMVHKCITAGGTTLFQEAPCAAQQQGIK